MLPYMHMYFSSLSTLDLYVCICAFEFVHMALFIIRMCTLLIAHYTHTCNHKQIIEELFNHKN